MKDLFNKGVSKLQATVDDALTAVSEKWTLFQETINELPILASLERAKNAAPVQYDEKHYFVIPFRLSKVGISLHTMRCLPDGVPELNGFPKRRVFHFPNEHSEHQLRELLLEEGRELALQASVNKMHSLEELANDIDRIDKKLTFGMLLVGGAAAFVNPVVGIGIAANAWVPVAGGLLNKFGLKPLGQKLTRKQVMKEIAEAEQKILSEFEHSSTVQVINPILEELELALRTTESEHDPLVDFDMGNLDIHELDGTRWRELTERAVHHVYKECLSDKSMWEKAGLGPEDIRWLKSILVSHIRQKKDK